MTEEKEFDGDIPGLVVYGESIPETWEKSLLSLNNNGLWYSRSGPKDKGRKQVDSTMTMTVKKPGSDLFFHKFIGTVPPQNLLAYAFEFLGAKDCLAVDHQYDPKGDTRWEYTYHRAFANYNEGIGKVVNQIEEVIGKLVNEPHKRNSQMITWRPELDLHENYPACMQRAWFFPVPMPDGSFKLNTNYDFRSRNPMTAAPMNLFGEYVFQNWVAHQVQSRIWQKPEQQTLPEEQRTKIITGRIIDKTDSYHISAQDQNLLQKFMENHRNSISRGETIEDRIYNRDLFIPLFQDMLNTGEVKNMIVQEISNRYVERTKLNPKFKKQLEKERNFNIGKLDEIDSWLRDFLK